MRKQILILLATMAVSVSLWASDNEKKAWPEEWRNVKYAKHEALPDARINKGEAIVKVRLLNYDPSKQLSLTVGGFHFLGQKESFHETYSLADDGTAMARVPLWLVRTAIVGIDDLAFAPVLLAPGETVEVLMDLPRRTPDISVFSFRMSEKIVTFVGNLHHVARGMAWA